MIHLSIILKLREKCYSEDGTFLRRLLLSSHLSHPMNHSHPKTPKVTTKDLNHVKTKDLKQGCFGVGGPNKHKQESLSLWCGLLVGEYTNFLEKKSHSIHPLAQGRPKNSRSSFLENG
jgi:hypothetical protein